MSAESGAIHQPPVDAFQVACEFSIAEQPGLLAELQDVAGIFALLSQYLGVHAPIL